MKNGLLSVIAILLGLNLMVMSPRPGTASPTFATIPPSGACCVGATCYTVEESECIGPLGGVYMGDGTQCSDIPDPCATPPSSGACCRAINDCVTVSEDECVNTLGGTFMGDGTTCDDNNGNGHPDLCELTTCPEDITRDGAVNVPDLLALLNAWGTTCP